MKKRRIAKILSNGESSRTLTRLARLIENRPFWKSFEPETRIQTMEKMLLAVYDLLMAFGLCKSVLTKRRIKHHGRTWSRKQSGS